MHVQHVHLCSWPCLSPLGTAQAHLLAFPPRSVVHWGPHQFLSLQKDPLTVLFKIASTQAPRRANFLPGVPVNVAPAGPVTSVLSSAYVILHFCFAFLIAFVISQTFLELNLTSLHVLYHLVHSTFCHFFHHLFVD